MSAGQGSVLADGPYGTAAGAEEAAGQEDPRAIIAAAGLRVWRELLLYWLRQVLAIRVAQALRAHDLLGYSSGHEECPCPRCGCCCRSWEECDVCGGAGASAPGALYEQDPLWYDPDATEPCSQCGGKGVWPVCLGRCAANGVHAAAAANGERDGE